MAICGVWATPGAPETLPNVLRRSRRTFGGPSRAFKGPSGPRRGPGGALRFLGTSKSDFVYFDVFSCFFIDFDGFKHVEVGSSPKEPEFDLFARAEGGGG